jgi:hypothetical protein
VVFQVVGAVKWVPFIENLVTVRSLLPEEEDAPGSNRLVTDREVSFDLDG